jgi:hypothetical protein
MKKILLGFAALPMLAMLATSCTNEIVESKDDKVIKFSTAVGKQTRATEITIESLQNTSGVELNVRSYEDGNNAVTDPHLELSLTYVGGNWTYSASHFHPIFGLTHYSIYPEDYVTSRTAVFDAGKDKMVESFDYTVATDPAAQKDLMVASANTTSETEMSSTAVLVYNHILSQVNFAIQGQEGLYISISNIKVSGVLNSGTYTFGSGWGPLAGAGNYDYTPLTQTTDGSGDILYLGNATGFGGSLNNNNALMLMPQDLTLGSGKFSFDYEIKNVDDIILAEGTDIDVPFSGLTPNVWEQGKRYLYTLDFEEIHYIKYTVSVVSWEDYDNAVGGEIDVETSEHY